MNDSGLADMLQALECTSEVLARTNTVAAMLVRALQQGEHVDPAVLADYAAQLERVQADNARMRDLIAAVVGDAWEGSESVDGTNARRWTTKGQHVDGCDLR